MRLKINKSKYNLFIKYFLNNNNNFLNSCNGLLTIKGKYINMCKVLENSLPDLSPKTMYLHPIHPSLVKSSNLYGSLNGYQHLNLYPLHFS